MRVLITGGGTGGHCTPALAVVEALRQTEPDAAVTFVGRSGGPEARIVTAAGVEFQGLTLGSMGSSRLTATPRLLTRLPLAYAQARRIVHHFGPDVVLATGGYVSVPVALVAEQRRLPILLLEQNALPGRAVSWLAQRATQVATSFPETAELLRGAAVVLTGNPVRRQFVELAPTELGALPRSLLVMGGSQGARHLNDVLLQALPQLLSQDPELEILHLTGPLDLPRVEAASRDLAPALAARYRCLGFSDQMAPLLHSAGLVVMRAGASSLAEVSCLGRPMLLVPYPHAGQHQAANARPFAAAGAAVVVPDSELTPTAFIAEVLKILGDRQGWEGMARASAAMARPLAAEQVARALVEMAQGDRHGR
ncbi:MAG: undecaprenyldiphospho-muramoylpentapeptide beta-N-acetylglucosaminyltransferase [Candidatus Dormibacteraeota bacterium]|nr:undecaprenyldiphospho-muramoylpentapeptide beta-N-acetylglucosaminyltransferase [Candidatus Dormibacteraeota bacterium]